MTAPKFQKCIYCLRHFDDLTWDHIPPRSWYPDHIPSDFAKWKVPACANCNNKLGKIEHKVMLRLGIALNQNNKNYESISKKVMKALDPRQGKNYKDTIHRKKALDSLLKEVQPYDTEKTLLFPGFEPQSKSGLEKLSVIKVPTEIKEFAAKMIRGAEYILEGNYIEATSDFKTQHVFEKDVKDVTTFMKQYGKNYVPVPGVFEFLRVKIRNDDGKFRTMYKVKIWDKYIFYSTIIDGTQYVNVVADVKISD